MKVKFNEFLAIIYADIFDWPLTAAEAKRWAIADSLARKGFYFWQPRVKLLRERKRREKIAEKKMAVAREITAVLARVPTIASVFLTGSVAVGNATEESDVDLMIVTAPGTLWLTRIAVILLLKAKKMYRSHSAKASRDKVCPNIFLDTDHLEIEEKNLYTAHEILQAKCLFDRGGIEGRWRRENKWTRRYLPNQA